MAMSAACLSPQPPIMVVKSWQHVPVCGYHRPCPAVCSLCTAAQSVTLGKPVSIQWRDVTEQNKLPVSRGRPVNKLASVDLAS